MKKESMRKYSLLGLILIGASAVTAAVLPKNDTKMINNGDLRLSGDGVDQTCVAATAANECTVTAGVGTRTSTAGEGDTSSITTLVGKDRTLSSVFIGSGDVVTTAQVHTSADEDNI